MNWIDIFLKMGAHVAAAAGQDEGHGVHGKLHGLQMTSKSIAVHFDMNFMKGLVD